jgi:hypothetical protein
MTSNPTNIIAINPGKKGAIAIVRGECIHATPLPTVERDLDVKALADIIAPLAPTTMAPTMAVVEKGGVAFNSTTGKEYGEILGILAAFCIPTEIVAPKTWKDDILKGTPRDRFSMIQECQQLFPDVPLTPGNKKDNIMETLCLLEHARRRFSGISSSPALNEPATIAAIREVMAEGAIGIYLTLNCSASPDLIQAAIARGDRFCELIETGHADTIKAIRTLLQGYALVIIGMNPYQKYCLETIKASIPRGRKIASLIEDCCI